MGLDAHVLVLGGQRSGKSRFAEGLVLGSGLPAGLSRDRDRRRRGDGGAHRARTGRAAARRWRTLEAPLDCSPTRWPAAATAGSAVLVDCLTLWLANLMEAGLDIDRETDGADRGARGRGRRRWCIVSNEVGGGIVPDNALARRYADAHGILNQRVAAAVGRVVLMTAGLPLLLKPSTSRSHRAMNATASRRPSSPASSAPARRR